MANGWGGARPGSGAKKGKQRAATQQAHEAIHLAFDRIGGVDGLVKWAEENRDAFYERVWPKVIPAQMQISGADGGPIEVRDIADKPLSPDAWAEEFAGPTTSH